MQTGPGRPGRSACIPRLHPAFVSGFDVLCPASGFYLITSTQISRMGGHWILPTQTVGFGNLKVGDHYVKMSAFQILKMALEEPNKFKTSEIIQKMNRSDLTENDDVQKRIVLVLMFTWHQTIHSRK